LSVVLYGCEPLIYYLKGEIQTELSYEQNTPNGEETTEVWRKLHSEAHFNFYSLSKILLGFTSQGQDGCDI
jgi:hypothetical protein